MDSDNKKTPRFRKLSGNPFEDNPEKKLSQIQKIKLNTYIRHTILTIFTLMFCISGISRNVLQRIFQFSDRNLFNQLHIIYYLAMPLGALIFQYIFSQNEKSLLLFSFGLLASSTLPLIYDFKYSYCAYASFCLKGLSEGIYFSFGSIWIERFAKRGFKYFCLCFFFLGKNLSSLLSEVMFKKIKELELGMKYFLIEFGIYIILSLITMKIDAIYFSDKLDCVNNKKDNLHLRPSNSPNGGSPVKEFKVSLFEERMSDEKEGKKLLEKQKILLTDQLNIWLIGFMFVGYFTATLFNEWLTFQFNITHRLKNIFSYMNLIVISGIFISLLFFLFIFKSNNTNYTLMTFLSASFIMAVSLVVTLIFNKNSLIVNIMAIIFYTCDYICIPIAIILCISTVSKSLRAHSVALTNSLAYLSFDFIFIINYLFGQSIIFEKSIYFCIASGIFGYICNIMTYRKINRLTKERKLTEKRPYSDNERPHKGLSDFELIVDEYDDE
ncbi:MAG: MFS transporter [archaeon]|nr:MFS transporter [archaeon]